MPSVVTKGGRPTRRTKIALKSPTDALATNAITIAIGTLNCSVPHQDSGDRRGETHGRADRKVEVARPEA